MVWTEVEQECGSTFRFVPFSTTQPTRTPIPITKTGGSKWDRGIFLKIISHLHYNQNGGNKSKTVLTKEVVWKSWVVFRLAQFLHLQTVPWLSTTRRTQQLQMHPNRQRSRTMCVRHRQENLFGTSAALVPQFVGFSWNGKNSLIDRWLNQM